MTTANDTSRRVFLKAIATLGGGALLASAGYYASRDPDPSLSTLWRLHPAFRIREISADEIIIWTNLGNGDKLQHTFKGIEADLIRQADAENPPGEILPQLARKNGLDEAACRKQLQKSIRELSKARLIYSGEKMLVKVVEVNHG